MLTYLIQQSKRLLIFAAIASVIHGTCSVLMLSQVNNALTADNEARASLAWVFAATAILVMISQMIANVLFERLSQRAHADLRSFITGKVMTADFRHLEKIGSAKIHSALSEHSANVAEFFVSVPAILTNAVIVAGCLVYMALLSWQVFIMAIVVIGLGSLGYHFAHLRAIRHLDEASKEQDQLFEHFKSITEGAKELRLNQQKSTLFSRDVLGQSIETVRRERALGMSIFVVSASWGNFLIFAFIGLVLFLLVGDIPDRVRVMTGFALVFVYMITPLEILLMNIPRANLARVSAERIDAVTQDMFTSETRLPDMTAQPLRSVALHGAVHRYYHEQSDEFFAMGPINLTLHAGEIIFLVGGNGSGKTTLAKLLVGLYPPEEGEIRLNDELVNDSNRNQYRQTFSAIFSDFYLFDRLLETGHSALDSDANRLIKRLHLHHKVQVRDGAFTTRSLSQGQRKRLALVVAILEDRPFLIFDEWAADQDPVFKEVFYRELLPELKAAGKAVLVISHDDRYFHLADRLLRMEDGQLIFDGTPHESESARKTVSA